MSEMNYQELREARGWSRERAAMELDLLDLDVQIPAYRLERIEKGAHTHPDEVWCLSRLYENPDLCYLYCQNEWELVDRRKRYFPDVNSQKLSSIVTRILNMLEGISENELTRILMDITEDGVIEQWEISELVKVQYGLEQLSLHVKELQLNVEKKLLKNEIDEGIYQAAWEQIEESGI